MTSWDERYDREDYLFGTGPNAFLERQRDRLRPGLSALAVADGEGRNGVWLAEQGLRVHSVDASTVAVAKARRLAASRGVDLTFEVADLLAWTWPDEAYDVVAAIFVHFAGPDQRGRLFAGMRGAVRPGGLVLIEGYRREQLACGTGGPSDPEYLFTADLLREAFAGFEILALDSYDEVLGEGTAHVGLSALVDLVARRPA